MNRKVKLVNDRLSNLPFDTEVNTALSVICGKGATIIDIKFTESACGVQVFRSAYIIYEEN